MQVRTPAMLVCSTSSHSPSELLLCVCISCCAGARIGNDDVKIPPSSDGAISEHKAAMLRVEEEITQLAVKIEAVEQKILDVELEMKRHPIGSEVWKILNDEKMKLMDKEKQLRDEKLKLMDLDKNASSGDNGRYTFV